jgi:23S rRNA (adenine2030-N6)-methyltransferase
MNYRHTFHAGNFADVTKHVTLIALVKALTLKDKGFCYLDTHAGAGVYDLKSPEAERSQEFQGGIIKVIEAAKTSTTTPPLIKDYLTCVLKESRDQAPWRLYPGSPAVAQFFSRPQDKLILCEIQPEAHHVLRYRTGNDDRAAVHLLDGYQGLKAFLPPPERRGLILIDPPYEAVNEFNRLGDALITAYQRFETGVYALWYPIKHRRTLRPFFQRLQKAIPRPTLTAELCIHPDDNDLQLNGTGLFIINPPWQLKQQLQPAYAWLWNVLSTDRQGQFRLQESGAAP